MLMVANFLYCGVMGIITGTLVGVAWGWLSFCWEIARWRSCWKHYAQISIGLTIGSGFIFFSLASSNHSLVVIGNSPSSLLFFALLVTATLIYFDRSIRPVFVDLARKAAKAVLHPNATNHD